jgi:hypothetical protein
MDTTENLLSYRERREGAGVAFSTVNRELIYLRAALRSAAKASPPLIPAASIPRFILPSEKSRVRSGFVVDEVLNRVVALLPNYLVPLTVCGYFSGVRRGELLTIRLGASGL